ncbi:MAG: hypothetical protein IH802_09565, partial [Nitrospinae bacterium]|nr:hypothetical protein [Nitrospinota bacterium]
MLEKLVIWRHCHYDVCEAHDPKGPPGLADIQVGREREVEEIRAIGLLVEHYKRMDDYRWKQMADDIRMKQLGRTVREAKKAGDAKVAQEAQIAQLRFDLHREKTMSRRQSRYYSSLVTRKTAIPTLKLFGLAPLFLDRYQK